MRRGPITATLLGVAAAALAGGCSGTGDDAQTSSTPATTTVAAGVTVRITDGDTGRPVPAVGVAAAAADGSVTQHVTGADGTVVTPTGTAVVRVKRQGWSETSGRPTGATLGLRIYDQSVQSPEYGGGPTRSRYVPTAAAPLPRGKPAWSFDGRTLIEFPPAVRDNLVVFGVNSGRVFALYGDTGRVRWARRLKSYIASTPSITGPRVYVTSMDGMFTAFRFDNGKRTFQFSTGGSPIESSPLVVDDIAYFGAWNGRLYAVNVRTGTQRWAFQASGAVKGSAVLAGGRIVFADYTGHVYAVDPRTGAERWRYSGGQKFYGGAGVSQGTVVIGDVGGDVIALDAATGRERWRHGTGAYVYSSPAIARGTVFIGSYAGRFEALDLRTGAVRWSFDAGGPISGSATVVGDVVYTAILRGGSHRTFGLDVRTGAVRFRAVDGRYSPVVAAGDTLYLVGTHDVRAYPATR